MKNFLKAARKGLRNAGKCLAVLAMAAILAGTQVPAQFGSANGLFPGLPATIAGVTRTNVNSVVVLPAGSTGFSIGAVMSATNASLSNVVFGLSFSLDGANFTAEKFSLIQPLNGTTNTVGFTNWIKDTFGSPLAVRLDYITNNHSSTITLSNVSFNTR